MTSTARFAGRLRSRRQVTGSWLLHVGRPRWHTGVDLLAVDDDLDTLAVEGQVSAQPSHLLGRFRVVPGGVGHARDGVVRRASLVRAVAVGRGDLEQPGWDVVQRQVVAVGQPGL
jgi:hypothetical protein